MEPQHEHIEAVKEAATEREGRMTLPCAEGFRVAERLGVNTALIGRICNDEDIRIVGCQLGCF